MGLLYCFHFFPPIWPSVCYSDWMISIFLYSKSLIHSSPLFILIFIGLSWAFLCKTSFLIVLLYSFWFLFTVLCISVDSLNSFSIFIISLLNSMSVILKRPVLLLIFFREMLILLTGSGSSAPFHLYLPKFRRYINCGLGELFVFCPFP